MFFLNSVLDHNIAMKVSNKEIFHLLPFHQCENSDRNVAIFNLKDRILIYNSNRLYIQIYYEI